MTNHSDGTVIGTDGLARPPWAAQSPLLREYYDTEWGMPVHDETELFERLVLESFQAGMSWAIILRKREAFRTAFDGFDPDTVALFDDTKVANLMSNEGIVRNERKIRAAITNAQATIALREEGGLDTFLWSFKPAETPAPRTMEEVPNRSPESEAMAKQLKKRGFTFVGPVSCFALMEAIGIVDTHLVGSYRRGSSGVWA
ncbi:3-methyladenine DNA glycosylase [Corynebacterium renale]|uniref:DNA-3-methyladenine glycosylase I n=1 Tax=Corynebacterium renale TaxID=1724 RepID=A0A2A9DLB7_9CORY|nr:DNA-3-methyladenine glycosylase I [Corynebacterium renale]PFG26975.1 DNA-3-methyladenine glycosylase I [Corynebacterium renale]SQG64297.1 3-methyladenine DNA glycosylase [Corynebacterium renale]SQI25213.1 3-methyladenine DNA glycosylase [Corynebacterium renale]STC94845.1 3-methyladenine DNA glycosylase [Corynebacterium renale]